MKQHLKYLALCTFGRNRSRYLAEYLEKNGLDVKYGGVLEDHEVIKGKIEEADVILTVHPDVYAALMGGFNVVGKQIVKLNVEDRPDVLRDDGRQLDGDEWTRFQEEHVYPALIEQVDAKLK